MRPCPGCPVEIVFAMCCPDCYRRAPDRVPGIDGDWRRRLRAARLLRRWRLAGRIIVAVQVWLRDNPLETPPPEDAQRSA